MNRGGQSYNYYLKSNSSLLRAIIGQTFRYVQYNYILQVKL